MCLHKETLTTLLQDKYVGLDLRGNLRGIFERHLSLFIYTGSSACVRPPTTVTVTLCTPEDIHSYVILFCSQGEQ